MSPHEKVPTCVRSDQPRQLMQTSDARSDHPRQLMQTSDADPIAYPKHVMLELTNACDLACRHCPYHGDDIEKQRPIGSMTEAMWRAALREIADWQVPVVLQPWGMGEPLLHPRLWDVVREAKRHEQLEVGFYSNGNQWQEKDIAEAFESHIDWICLSIDGVQRDVFEHYRVGADLDRVLATLEALHEERARRREHGLDPGLQIRVNMVAYPELSEHVDEAVAFFRRYADSVMVSRFRKAGDRRFSPVNLPRIPCYQLYTMMAITCDGHVVQCCEDQQGEASVGAFPARSLAEIWNGQALRDRRRAHEDGRFADVPHCSDCDAWTGWYEIESSTEDAKIRERTAGKIYEAPPVVERA